VVVVTEAGKLFEATATCPAFHAVTGGGFEMNATNGKVARSIPSRDMTSWIVGGTGGAGLTITAYAVCIPIGGGVA
jgi:hypothetical protein